MGTLIDNFSCRGEIEMAFVFCGNMVLVLLLHTLTMVFSMEIPVEADTDERKNPIREMLGTLRDKKYAKGHGALMIWHMATNAINHFLRDVSDQGTGGVCSLCLY